jgi:hypothetical protein
VVDGAGASAWPPGSSEGVLDSGALSAAVSLVAVVVSGADWSPCWTVSGSAVLVADVGAAAGVLWAAEAIPVPAALAAKSAPTAMASLRRPLDLMCLTIPL